MKIALSALALFLSLAPLDASVMLVHYDFEFGVLYPTTTTHPDLVTGGPVATDAGPSNNASTRLRRRFPQNRSSFSPVWGNSTPLIRVQEGRIDLASAIEHDSSFAITLNPQDILSLTSLYLDIATDGGASPHGLAIRSSLTGSTNLFNETVSGSPTSPQPVSIDLTPHEAFQDISDPVTFTFYLWNEGNSNSANFYADNISFYGVPEPGSAALLGLGAAGLLLKRRRRA